MEGITFYFDWEIWIMKWLQEHTGSFGAALASVITNFGEEMVIIAVLGFLYWCYDKELGRYMGISICIGIVLNPLIKNIVVRRRPYFDHPEIKCLRPVDKSADLFDISAQGYSFPSGHSFNSVIAYGGIGVYKKKRNLFILGIVISATIAISRVVVGVHYPTDVLAGLLMGLCVIWLFSVLYKRVRNRRLMYLIIFLISCVGMFYCRTSDYYSALGTMGGFFLGDIFEGKYVRFENTRVWYKCVLRLLGGFALFLGLNALLKLPFSHDLLSSGTFAAFMIRFFRYVAVTFVIVGLYPKLFTREGMNAEERADAL